MQRLLLITWLALSLGQSFAAETNASPILQLAYNQLVASRDFAFGATGYDRMTSRGEAAFRRLAASPDGLPFFRAALTNGTPEAKLYALCGIRHLAPEQFDALASPIIDSRARVILLMGTMRTVMEASQIATQIKGGSYDYWFPPQKNKGIGP